MKKLKIYKNKLEILKKNKKNLEKNLMTIMKNNSVDEIDTNNYKIIYSQKKVKKSITKKYLKNILAKYFENNLSKAEEVENYIQNNREEIIKENIKKKLKK
mgnify:CR=1 FL=1